MDADSPVNPGPDSALAEDPKTVLDEAKPSLRFLRANRVVSGSHFGRAYKQGNRARGKWMTVVVVANGLDVSRLGLSIGKRVWRDAVGRNRVRRVFREAFRVSLPELPTGVDVVLIGSTPRIEPNLQDTAAELVHLARKAHERYLEKVAAQGAE
jgi:ribonuclease P protein component